MNYKIILQVIIFGGAGMAHLMAATPDEEPLAETEVRFMLWPGMNHQLSSLQDPKRRAEADAIEAQGSSRVTPYVPSTIYIRPSPEEDPEPLQISSNRLSKAMTISHDGEVMLYRKDHRGGVENPYIPLGRIRLNPEEEQVVTFLFSLQERGGNLNAKTISTDNDLLGPGKTATVNLAPQEVLYMINEARGRLRPGEMAPVEMSEESNALRFRIASRDRDGQLALRHQRRIVLNPEASNLLIVYSSQARGDAFRILTLNLL